MPPKKATGKGKKVSASELEQQRLGDAVQNLIRIKEAQLQEQSLGKFNAAKVQSKWRDIMKKVKTAELKKELDQLESLYNHQLDQKNAAAETLAQDLELANDQHNTLMSSYLENLQTLLDFTQRRAEMMQGIYERDLAVINNEFNAERAYIQTQHTKEKARMLDILHRMEYEFLEAETDAKHEFSSFRDDVKNKNLEEKHALRIQLEGIVEDLWRQFQAALSQYNASTEERKKQFEELKEKDFKTAKEIESQIRKLGRLQENIGQLKSKFHNNAREFEEKLHAVREEKESNHAHFQEFKRLRDADRSEDHEQLALLAVQSGNALKKLESKKELAEKLLRIAEMNSKLESEHEKVLFTSLAAQSDNDIEDSTAAEQLKQEAEFLVPEEITSLGNFHKRYNKVLLDKLTLTKRKQDLLAENQVLRNVLKEYLDGVAVNEQILAERNTLLIVNGKSSVPIKVINSISKQQASKVATKAQQIQVTSKQQTGRIAIPN